MQMDDFSKYQDWIKAEMECANGVRKRKRVVFWKVNGILLAAYAAIFLICFVVGMCSEKNGEDMIAMAAACVLLLFILTVLITFLCMAPGFFKGKYARKIKRAIKRQGFQETQREQFAREQMAARNDPAKSVSFVITKGQDHMPAQFTLSEHFACLTGGTGFGPYIIPVDGMEAFCVHTNRIELPVVTRVFFLVIHMEQSITTQMIRFIGHGREQGRLSFGDPEACEKVLNILRQRFPEASGR